MAAILVPTLTITRCVTRKRIFVMRLKPPFLPQHSDGSYKLRSRKLMPKPPLSIDVAEANAASPPVSTLPYVSLTAPTMSLVTSRAGSPLESCPWSPNPTPNSESGVPGSAATLPESLSTLKKHKWKADEDALLQRLVAEMATEGGKVRWSAVGAHAWCTRRHDGLGALRGEAAPVGGTCVCCRAMAQC